MGAAAGSNPPRRPGAFPAPWATSSARASPTANRCSAGRECPPPRGAAVQARVVRAPRPGRDAAPERRVAGRDLGAPRGRGAERRPRLMDQVDVGKVALRPSQHTLSGRWSGAASGPWTVLASPAPGLTCAEPRALCCPPGLGTPGPARALHRRLHRARPEQRPAPGCRAFAEGSGATLSLVPAAAPGLALSPASAPAQRLAPTLQRLGRPRRFSKSVSAVSFGALGLDANHVGGDVPWAPPENDAGIETYEAHLATGAAGSGGALTGSRAVGTNVYALRGRADDASGSGADGRFDERLRCFLRRSGLGREPCGWRRVLDLAGV